MRGIALGQTTGARRCRGGGFEHRGQQRIIRSVGATYFGLSLLLTACGGGGGDDTDTKAKDEPAPTELGVKAEDSGGEGSGSAELPDGSTWAAVTKDGLGAIAVYPDATSPEPAQTIPRGEADPKPAFLVDGADVSGARIPVFLPVPPSGSTGWINKSDVDLAQNPYRIKIETAAHRLTVTKGGGETVLDTTVALGRDSRETQPGNYFVTSLLDTEVPDGDYGPWIFTISGFPTDAEILQEFGDDAVIGIHGTNQPELLGQDVSSGCIRMSNDDITAMREYLPVGTPVEIVS